MRMSDMDVDVAPMVIHQAPVLTAPFIRYGADYSEQVSGSLLVPWDLITEYLHRFATANGT
jgi:hypothetical protein